MKHPAFSKFQHSQARPFRRSRGVPILAGGIAVVLIAGGVWVVRAWSGDEPRTPPAPENSAASSVSVRRPAQAASPDTLGRAGQPPDSRVQPNALAANQAAILSPPALAADTTPARLTESDQIKQPESDAHEEILEPRSGGATRSPSPAPTSLNPTAPANQGTLTSMTSSPRPAAAGAPPDSDRTPTGPAANAAVEAAWTRYNSGDKVAARHQLNAMLGSATSELDRRQIRNYLARIADETLFSRQRQPNDPLVGEYTISAGDRLARLAPKYNVPYEALMLVNGITDRIREGQRIKTVQGPFHARISKSDFRIDLYLQDLYVRSYRVGLGENNGTPTGVWKVTERLPNPTFHAPAGYDGPRIIAADDPKNPLGEYWIGLEGVEGETVGKTGFGIHGTIEPETIGRAASLGCVRMLNEEVSVVYNLLQPGHSTVTIVP